MNHRPSGTRTRLLAVGDIGSTTPVHVGDEALMQGLIRDLAASGGEIDWTVMSSQPAWSARQLGVRCVPRLSFADCATPDARERRIEAFDDGDARSVIGDCDAVVLAGGGNLHRTWPGQVFERAAVVRAAARAGRPVLTTGQTIGPALDATTRELVREILAGSAFIGLREARSYSLALELGAHPSRTILHVDDAAALGEARPAFATELADGEPFIAVTLNEMGTLSDPLGVAARLAAQLVLLRRQTGATILMVPHVGDLDAGSGHDVAMNLAVQAAAGPSAGLRLAPLPTPEEAVWYCRHAETVVSTRYHPVVWAAASGTPVLFLYQDRYTCWKGEGALALAGLQDWMLSVSHAALGLLAPAALDLWTSRNAIRAHLQSVAPMFRQSRREHGAAFLAALGGWAEPASMMAPIITRRGPMPQGEWTEESGDGLAWIRAHVHDASWTLERDSLQRHLARKESELVTAQAALAAVTARPLV